jgi:uncharacterized repeat protein (TIGR03806 family)
MCESPSLRAPCDGSGTATLLLLLGLVACSGVDTTLLSDPRVAAPSARPAAFLKFPADARRAPTVDTAAASKFPSLLSETGAFRDAEQLQAAPGLVPYDLQSPLWSDGAYKRRWISLPELGSVTADDEAPWGFPPGTIFVKHFEMPLDERTPEVRRRLETRLLVAAPGGTFYGVTYRWNAEQTDAELVLAPQTEDLSIIDPEGATRDQSYYYPGPSDCISCHTSSAGYVLGLRTRQLNHEFDYGDGLPAINQLVSWSAWGFLDRTFSDEDAAAEPRLANVSDESQSLEKRVRSYWDGNCSMCHAGTTGSVAGWDARFITPLPDQGLDRAPQMPRPGLPKSLIAPGDPAGSYIYLRSATADKGSRMPPIGRNRVDQAYVEVLARWIDSL